MKYKHLGILWIAALFLIGMPAANALTLNFSSEVGSAISFDGSGNFSFTDGSLGGFKITLSDGVGDSVGLFGSVSGTFTIGAISTSGGDEVANVSGSGNLTITDASSNVFSATVTFVDIKTAGAGGIIETQGTANVTGISYAGSNSDLLALLNAPGVSDVVTFQFNPPKTLTELKSTITSTSYSGTLTAVPIPAAVWLFGSALMGATVIARRKKSLPKEMAA